MKRIFPGVAMTLCCTWLSALPSDPRVVLGDAVFNPSEGFLEIQASDRAAIDWGGFSIGPNETARFIQPSSSSFVINQVMGGDLSSLLGRLESNGGVYLINPNGILFGEDCVVDTSSFIASTFPEISDLCFKGDSEASIINRGRIIARDGDAVLIAASVENQGAVEAPLGSALFGAGSEVLIQPSGRERLFVRASAGTKEGTGVENSGTIQALRTELKANGNLYSLAVHHSGSIDALGVAEKNGEVFLVAEEGLIEVWGSITAPQGEVRILGDDNRVYGTVDVSSASGGGTVLVGGGYQGKDPLIRNSKKTFVSEMATISASANQNGDGGKIILWSDTATANGGMLLARGGEAGGNGGLIEISSKGYLNAAGFPDTRAPLGKVGTLLLDPCTVTITTMNTGIMMFPPPDYIFSGASADIKANMGMMNIQSFLALSDVTINAAASGSAVVPGSITVFTPIMWSSGNKLTMIADGSITFLANVASSAMGLASTHVVLDLQAPLITIGALDTASAIVGALSPGFSTIGKALVSASTGLEIFGGPGAPSALAGDVVEITVGDLLIHAGIAGGSGALIGIETLFQGTVAGDVLLFSSGGGTGISSNSMAMQTSTILLDVAGGVTLIGGSTMAPSGSAAAILNWSGGLIDCNIGGDLVLQAGASDYDGNAAIFGQGAVSTLQVAARDIYITGGSAAVMPMGSGNFAGIATFVGQTSVVSTGPNGIVLQGGSDVDCTAFIQGADGVFVTAPSLQLNGGSVLSANAIVGGGVVCELNISGNLALNGLGSGAGIFAIAGDLNASVGGNCTIVGSTLTPPMGISLTGLNAFGPAPGFAGNVNLTTQNLFITGGSGDSCLAGVSAGYNFFSGMFDTGGAIDLNVTGSTGIHLTGGSGASSPAVIEIFGSDPTNSITFTAPHPSANLLLTGTASEARIATFSGPIVDPVGGSIILDGAASIIVGPGPVSPLLLIAGRNIELRSALSSIENQSGGDLTLVVDNNFPNPFLFGSGFFSSVANSNVFTNDGVADGLLRIFTSQQNLNNISGFLNNVNFSNGTLFANSATEQWQTWYPSAFGGVPYTVFYKNSEQLLTSQALTIVDQLLYGLHPLNEYPGWMMEFSIGYASASGGYSSLHESGDEPYFLRRRHLKFINHPKSYTVLME